MIGRGWARMGKIRRDCARIAEDWAFNGFLDNMIKTLKHVLGPTGDI